MPGPCTDSALAEEKPALRREQEVSLETLEPARQISAAIFGGFQKSLAIAARQARAIQLNAPVQQRREYLILRGNGRGMAAIEVDDRQSPGLIGLRERMRLGKDGAILIHVARTVPYPEREP